MTEKQRTAYPLRMPDEMRKQMEDLAHAKRRTLHAELLAAIDQWIHLQTEAPYPPSRVDVVINSAMKSGARPDISALSEAELAEFWERWNAFGERARDFEEQIRKSREAKQRPMTLKEAEELVAIVQKSADAARTAIRAFAMHIEDRKTDDT